MRLSNFWIPSMESARTAMTQANLDTTTLASQLKADLDAVVGRAQEAGFPPADVQLALFAVVAWIDELAMSREWSGAAAWRLSPLQRHYFSTTRAGVAFFEKLEALPDDAIDVREVYGLVLLAGFHGRYTHRPSDELAQYRATLLERIAQERQMDPLAAEYPLFPQAGARAHRLARRTRGFGPSLATFVLIVLPLCVLLALYLFLDHRLANSAAQLIAPLTTHL